MSWRSFRILPLALQLGVLGGCVVPQARYEEARSALAVEQEAHRRTTHELYGMSRKLDELSTALAARERALAEAGEQLSAKEMSLDITATERDSATQVVDQLREELSRVGNHLRAFADQKSALATALDAAEARSSRLGELERAASRRTLFVRDLSLLLGEAITTGEVELGVSEGRPVVRLEHSSAFIAGSGELQPGTRTTAAALARVMRLHPEARLRISRQARDEQAAAVELRRIGAALESEGVAPARIEIAVENSEQDGAPVEIYVL
jgi:flagellar motor protein MotB